MIQNYIFDLYGTLVDIRTDESMPSLWKQMARLFSLQGAAYSSKELQNAYLDAVNDQIEQRWTQLPTVCKAHVEPDILLVFKMLYDRKGVSVSTDRARDTALFFRSLSLRHIRLYPNAKKVLDTLRARGRGVYLLSNAQSAFTVPELNKLGLAASFDGIVLSSDVGIKKPDRGIFEYLLSKYALCPENSLMIGNDGDADIQGASSAGMASRYIHTRQSPAHPSRLPDTCQEIYGLQELLQ